MKKIKCGECRWYDDKHQSINLVPMVPGKYTIGFCRKHKPMFYSVDRFYYGVWGVVDSEEFCGEYRQDEGD